MEKLDMKKALKECYTGKKGVKFVTVPKVKYLTYQGKGNPNNSEEFQSSMEVLFGMAYKLKFLYKKQEKDFAVMPLEGQWWTDVPEDFSLDNKDIWNWKVMIALPDYVTEEAFEEARGALKKKKDPVGLEKATLETQEDGLVAQFLYVGPYEGEAPYIEDMHNYVKTQGYKLKGKHREIYLNSPQRVAPEKLKTIIRHPIEKM